MIIPSKGRSILYAIGLYGGYVLHSVLVAYAVLVLMHVVPGYPIPLIVAYAVYATLATPLFGVAKANLSPDPTAVLAQTQIDVQSIVPPGTSPD